MSDGLRDLGRQLGFAPGRLAPLPGAKALCHKLVAQVAQEAAGELYESLMHDNGLATAWRARFPGMASRALEKRFIRDYWPRCIPFARATLAQLLTRPIDEETKSIILDALVKDNSLQPGRPDINQAALVELSSTAGANGRS